RRLRTCTLPLPGALPMSGPTARAAGGERGDLTFGGASPAARLEGAEPDRAVAHTHEAPHRVPDRLEHTANFTLSPLPERHADPGSEEHTSELQSRENRVL